MTRINLRTTADLARLRRIALDRQGLLRSAPFGRGGGGALRAIEHLGYVQIDTIAVVERAHHHVLRSRVPNFEPPMLERLRAQGRIFEYWSHAAAYLPMRDYRFTLPRKAAIRAGKRHWQKSPDRPLMRRLLQQVRSEGPLRSRELDGEKSGPGGWWNWKPAKRALEQLFMEGELMISQRTGFEKTYDLPERVLPADTDTRMPTTAELAAHLIDQQLACHGLVTLKGLTYLRRDPALRAAVQADMAARRLSGALDEITIRDERTVYFAPPGLLETRAPRASAQVRVLSPFDNAIIQRQRAQQLFDFDYQIECYLPASQRTYGYFCLPLLYRDGFIGRIDCKARRDDGVLELRSLFLDVPTTAEQLRQPLVDSLREFTTFQGCTGIASAEQMKTNLDATSQRRLTQCLVD